uniref:cell cycle progression protein 1-like isoform X2 n=1 Tax=Myxine glutinosa TaxID=7769 RepID=UPI00358E888D
MSTNSSDSEGTSSWTFLGSENFVGEMEADVLDGSSQGSVGDAAQDEAPDLEDVTAEQQFESVNFQEAETWRDQSTGRAEGARPERSDKLRSVHTNISAEVQVPTSETEIPGFAAEVSAVPPPLESCSHRDPMEQSSLEGVPSEPCAVGKDPMLHQPFVHELEPQESDELVQLVSDLHPSLPTASSPHLIVPNQECFQADPQTDSSSEDVFLEPPVHKRHRRSVPLASLPCVKPMAPGCEDELVETSSNHSLFPAWLTLDKCILFALVVALSLGIGHFYAQLKGQQREVEEQYEDEIDDIRNDLVQCQQERKTFYTHAGGESGMLSDARRLAEENEVLRATQAHLQSNRQELESRLHEADEARRAAELARNEAAQDGERLKAIRQRDEATLAVLRQEVATLNNRIRSLRQGQGKMQMGTKMNEEPPCDKRGRDLRDDQKFLGVTEKLRRKLAETEGKLSMLQQRAHMWERLYVQAREEGTVVKGDNGERQVVTNNTRGFRGSRRRKDSGVTSDKNEGKQKFLQTYSPLVTESLQSGSGVERNDHSKYIVKGKSGHIHQSRHRPGTRAQGARDVRNYAAWHQQRAERTSNDGFVGEKRYQKQRLQQKTSCSTVTECAHLEALLPVSSGQFQQLLRDYVGRLAGLKFPHWPRLDGFVRPFFGADGVFAHDRTSFRRFVDKVEDFLEDELGLEEPKKGEDLDDFILRRLPGHRHTSRHGRMQASFECWQHERRCAASNDAAPCWEQGKENRRSSFYNHHHNQQCQRPCSMVWYDKTCQATGHRMAGVEIELGPMLFGPNS